MNEHIHKHNEDGIDNDEHIIDMEKQGQMLYQNIKDNTDSAIQLVKTFEEMGDDDISDAVKIDASEILEIEKNNVDNYNNFEKLFNILINLKEIDNKQLEIFENYFDALKSAEERSTELFNKLLKKLK